MKKFLLTSLILPCLFLSSGCQESECGDGVLEGDEECDGKQLSKTCQDFGFVQGEPTCDELTCKINTITCKNSDIECGNGLIEGNEQCDGQAVNNATCPDGSPRSCDDSCSFVPCGNTPQPVCGNNIKEQGEQCDGNTSDVCQDGSSRTCLPNCTLSACKDQPSSICGNDIKEQGEQCDGKDVPFETCPDGSLRSCNNICQLVDCPAGPVCGNNIKEQGEQCDGRDISFETCPDGSLRSCDDKCQLIDCLIGPICGNGIKEQGEQCAFNEQSDVCINESTYCRSNCTVDDCSKLKNSTIIRQFTLRFKINQKGDLTSFGNSILSCNPLTDSNCTNARNGLLSNSQSSNNAYIMTYIDVDNNSSTFNSSSADLVLDNESSVLWAGLYWGASVNQGTGGVSAINPVKKDTVLLKNSKTNSYLNISASNCDDYNNNYQCYSDITNIITTIRSSTYTIANLQTGTGKGRYAGWSIIVAYKNENMPSKTMAVYDGYAMLGNNSAFRLRSTDINPTRSMDFGLITYEGDYSVSDGPIIVNGKSLQNNIFNSSNHTQKRNPNYKNQLGYDIDHFYKIDIKDFNGLNINIQSDDLCYLGAFYITS